MRKWLSLAAVAVIAAGCNKSPEGGTPGTDSSFKISGPNFPSMIKQGNTETASLSLDRGKAFTKDVKLSVKTSENSKINAKLNKDVIKASEPTDFNVTLEVAKDAPLANHTVTVTGTPEGGGAPTSVDFTVRVTAP